MVFGATVLQLGPGASRPFKMWQAFLSTVSLSIDEAFILLRMRARWAIWIAGGVLALAMVVLLSALSSEPPRIGVRVLGQTNDGTCYLIQVTNITRESKAFLAWVESTANGPIPERLSETHGPAIPRNSSHTFTLERPADARGKRRIAVICYPATDSTWKRRWYAAKVFVGLRPSPRTYTVRVDVE